MMNFFERVAQRQSGQKTLLCIGLDPDPGRFPPEIARSTQPVFTFNKAIVDATLDLVCCYKPQIAHYASIGAEAELEQTIQYIQDRGVPVLLDAKRGDVDSTARMYARELFVRYNADAATINPYLGFDAMEPYLEWQDRGLLILCRTSNPGAADIQDLMLASGKHLYEHVAEMAAGPWNLYGNVGLVTGATRPSELARIRQLVGDMTLLLPGIGAQGGDIQSSIEAGQGGGLIASSSRAIIYAAQTATFAECARAAAIATRDQINACRSAG